VDETSIRRLVVDLVFFNANVTAKRGVPRSVNERNALLSWTRFQTPHLIRRYNPRSNEFGEGARNEPAGKDDLDLFNLTRSPFQILSGPHQIP
jgi:hypothetical protein